MAARGVPSRKLRAAFVSALSLGAFALAGCASASYAGIPLASGAADQWLQALARRAQGGDKWAQLELGILYEEGLRLPRDLGRSRALYKAAASDGDGANYVYAPPVGGKGTGQLIRVRGGVSQLGLHEARLRLNALKAHRRTTKR